MANVFIYLYYLYICFVFLYHDCFYIELQRDSWMESPLDLIPTTSKKEILEQKRQEKQKERNDEPNLLDLVWI